MIKQLCLELYFKIELRKNTMYYKCYFLFNRPSSYFVCSSTDIDSSICRLNPGYCDCTSYTISSVSTSYSSSQTLSVPLLLPGDCWSRDTSRGARDFYLLVLSRSNSAWSRNHLCWHCKQEKKMIGIRYSLHYDSHVKVIFSPISFKTKGQFD